MPPHFPSRYRPTPGWRPSVRRGREFVVVTDHGWELPAAGIVAASGPFSNPHRPVLPGQARFTGRLLHVAEYRNTMPYAAMRVVVVGAGDSAAQVANELARLADVTLAVRHPLRFIPQRIGGRNVHYWLRGDRFDSLPAAWLRKISGGSLISDSVGFQRTLDDGLLDVRPMFIALDRDEVVWSDDERERVDAIILATGYRPSLDYLRELGALDADGGPLHVDGISTTHLGLVTWALSTSDRSPPTPFAGSAPTLPPGSPRWWRGYAMSRPPSGSPRSKQFH